MKRWQVLFSKPHKEFLLRDELARRGVEAYLPLCPPAGRRTRSKPLFFRYLFAYLDIRRVSPEIVKWLPGSTRFLTFGGEYAFVDDAVIQHIRVRLARLEQRGNVPFRRGQRVRIAADHPLAMLDAVFEKPLSGGARAHILVHALGRLMRCDVDTSALELVGEELWRGSASL